MKTIIRRTYPDVWQANRMELCWNAWLNTRYQVAFAYMDTERVLQQFSEYLTIPENCTSLHLSARYCDAYKVIYCRWQSIECNHCDYQYQVIAVLADDIVAVEMVLGSS
jgi:CBS-domain-containing membrane protein